MKRSLNETSVTILLGTAIRNIVQATQDMGMEVPEQADQYVLDSIKQAKLRLTNAENLIKHPDYRREVS